MSSIKGEVREDFSEFSKKIGIMTVEVITINPTRKEYKDILGMELKEDSKADTYTGESNDGNPYVRVDFWLQAKDFNQRFKVSYFIENKDRLNKAGDKTQFINNIGVCSWGATEDDLPAWFLKREFRVAKNGEEDLYSFLRAWLGKLAYENPDTELEIDFKKLIKGNVEDLKEQIGSKWSTPFLAMGTVVVKENSAGEVSEYQGIYAKAFMPIHSLKHFQENDFTDKNVIKKINAKTKDVLVHERFIKNVLGEYGCKDIFHLGEAIDYVSEDHLASSESTVGGEGVYEDDEDVY